jgi:hypothetical protein
MHEEYDEPKEDVSETVQEDGVDAAAGVEDELTLLRQRADLMGIKYHPNIGVDKLKEKIAYQQEEIANNAASPKATDESDSQEEQDALNNNMDISEAKKDAPITHETTGQRRVRLRREATKLVRVRVTNMNPLKSALKGEIFSVGNAQIGFIKKFVPFNAEQGWHIPQIILTHIQNKKFLTHYEANIGGKKIKKHRLVPEYAVEILPPLTAEELKDLAQRQLAASN